ncbi:YdeI/OmpD-associated family protein [Leucobacter allii]|uniref:YdeI/OmpD-associated family protein n=1 Tax=Leucobacter allii TaxID=2932247 RepID=UPI001FD62523|nr:YdeI/OmpD-associated family protein [Leucobacter allii]UOR01567.1 YdeI/OmpD-associated family protein [Leucobacter allii]
MTLQRAAQPMPVDIADILAEQRLRDAYDDRPAYQRNDYLAWIARAKRTETRTKRITQMLDELAEGGVYMGMRHRPSRR